MSRVERKALKMEMANKALADSEMDPQSCEAHTRKRLTYVKIGDQWCDLFPVNPHDAKTMSRKTTNIENDHLEAPPK